MKIRILFLLSLTIGLCSMVFPISIQNHDVNLSSQDSQLISILPESMQLEEKTITQNSTTTSDFNALLDKAYIAINNNNWKPVLDDLTNFKNFDGTNDQNEVLKAIQRLTALWNSQHDCQTIPFLPTLTDDYTNEPPIPSDNEPIDFRVLSKHKDQQKIQIANHRLSISSKPTLTIAKQIEYYFKDSQLRFLNAGEQKIIKDVLLELKEWPGSDNLKNAEIFYWNINYSKNSIQNNKIIERNDYLTKLFFSNYKNLNWQIFITWAETILLVLRGNKSCDLAKLSSIYLSLPDDAQRYSFITWAEPILLNLNNSKIPFFALLCPIYKSLPDNNQRDSFITWAEPMIMKFDPKYRISYLAKLSSIYLSLPDDIQLRSFMTWVEPIIKKFIDHQKISYLVKLLSVYKELPDSTQRHSFITWIETIMVTLSKAENLNLDYFKAEALCILLPIYKSLPDALQRDIFITWAEPIIKNINYHQKFGSLVDLLSVYKELPDSTQRHSFITWAEPIVKKINHHERVSYLAIFISVYKKLPDATQRDFFITWAEPIIKNLDHFKRVFSLFNIFSIYQALSDDTQRDSFMMWAEPIIKNIDDFNRVCYFNNLFSIYQAIPDDVKRNDFINWVEPIMINQYITKYYQINSLNSLLYIYQDDIIEKSFKFFMNLHHVTLKNDIYKKYNDKLLESFIPRTYLNYMRSLAALTAEPYSLNIRIQSIYETAINDPLPAFWIDDPLMQKLRTTLGFVNVHEFETLYPSEFELLKTKTSELGYPKVPSPSSKTYTIYNGANNLPDYKTNTEVEDFINYLDNEFLKQQENLIFNGIEYSSQEIVILVKQILGLEPKSSSTSGSFAPYLGHSMLYAEPNSDKGDEVLGRVWFLMKHLISDKQEANTPTQEELLKLIRDDRANRRSVVLAILESSELSKQKVHTHCQTRMTGELLKLACWHLGKESQLRKLIAHNDAIEVHLDADIELRIAGAPIKASNIFKAIKDGSSNFRKLLEYHDILDTKPQLYEYYLTYYDDLYQRTPIRDINGALQLDAHGKIQYFKDNHILERDDIGNLVSRYNDDGTLRLNHQGFEEPLIVYYQAEFSILEYEFTKLMKTEFEDNRCLVY